MVSFAAAERTEPQFRALLNEAGPELVRAWMPPLSRTNNVIGGYSQARGLTGVLCTIRFNGTSNA